MIKSEEGGETGAWHMREAEGRKEKRMKDIEMRKLGQKGERVEDTKRGKKKKKDKKKGIWKEQSEGNGGERQKTQNA